MSPEERAKYESLNKQDRAKWLLRNGITAELTIDPEKLEPAYKAYSCGYSLPKYYKTADQAVVQTTRWLAEIAKL